MGVSQEALAHAADVERSYLGRIERGESQPTLHVILKVARALGIAAGTLVGTVESVLFEKPTSRRRSN
jgi:transcriptional regulator with XRE-family HTH domain